MKPMRILLALLLSLLSLPAWAQVGLVMLPSDQFGKVVIRLPQSAGGISLLQLQNVLGRSANFEPLSAYREQDRFRRIALPVGRLDVIVNNPSVPGAGYSWCTASIISARHIITNNHCFPEGQGGVRQAFLLMDYYSDDNEAAVRRFEVRAVPVERNAALDFAIAEVTGNPSATFGRIALEPRDPEPGESLLIIHHPLGKPKHMTRGNCRAHAPVAVQGTDIRHRCDTMPGSSGSPILAEGSGRMLGLHYGGSLDAQTPGSFNSGKRLSEISGRSRVLAAAVAEQRQEEEAASRAASSQSAAERAEIERRAREQAEAAAKAEVDRLKAQLEAERARFAALPPAAAPRADPAQDWAAAETALGLTTEQVRSLQGWLEALGHDPRGVDGRLGGGTRAALRGYQKAKGLPETGHVSADVARMLSDEGPEAVRKRDAARAALAAAVRPPAPATPPSPAQPAVGIFPAPARPTPPRPGDVVRDCSDCPELVVVPAGSFMMGASPGEEEAENVPSNLRGRSSPQVEVRIGSAFAVGRMEVTRGEFAAFVRETGHATGSSCWAWDGSKWAERAGANWRSPGFSQDDRHPAVCVSWDDAQAYVRWLSSKTGKSYRLLSEAEWEYAARAGSQTRRPWGDSAEAGCGHANIADASARRQVSGITGGAQCDDGHGYTSAAGSYRANGFGLHDMIGNVWEWTADCWNENLSGLPTDGSARTSGDCARRVLRGGSWLNYPRDARSAKRSRDPTADRDVDLGFRVARTL
jgi:formylglycine-generating enzyme required for sulfatase activity